MAEKSSFFNSVNGDRKYKAEDMAAHFAKVLTNGVMPAGTQLQATEVGGMNVVLSTGSAWINGYAYHNDSNFSLAISPADGVLNRIDRIVVRWSRVDRAINLIVLTGAAASAATAPAIVRNADYYDLGIATISVNKGITAVTQAMITDTRMDSNVCGFVSSLIKPDTSGWFTQFETAFNNLVANKQSDWGTWFSSAQTAFNNAMTNNQSNWDTWFATIKNALDGNTAGNLLNLINTKAAKGANTDITALSGLTTALSIPQGGTGASSSEAARTNIGAAKAINKTATLVTANWTGSAAPYTYKLADAEILATDRPFLDRVTGTDAAAAALINTAWGLITGYAVKPQTAAGTITFYASAKPAVAIPIMYEAVRT